MRNKKILRFLLYAIALVIVAMNVSCKSSSADEHGVESNPGHSEHGEDDEHAGHDHHGEEEEYGADLKMSTGEILKAECEHDVLTYKCAECRYEVGVVRVDQSLTANTDGNQPLIHFASAEQSDASFWLSTTGEVQFDENRTVRVSVPIAGVIFTVKADIGQEVKKKNVLFEIRSAELVEIVSDYLRASDMAYLSGKNYSREKELHNKSISSEQDMVNAKMVYRDHSADLRSARQRLYALGLTAGDIKREKKTTKGILAVRSPINGVIIKKDVAVNETVEPGSELMIISDPETLWVWADVYEKDLARLPAVNEDSSIEVEITFDSFPGRVFKGRMNYVSAVMDESTRTIKVRIVLPNSDRLLRAGMFCNVRIPLVKKTGALLVPKQAVLSDEGQDFVFTNLEDDYWVRRPVIKGMEFRNKVEVLEGLKPGEIIATEGAFLLKSDVLREKMGAGCAD